jgi:hypothetical protein
MARLRKPHPFVAATQSAALERTHPDPYGRLRPAPTAGLIPLAISRPQLRRAMLLLNALFKLAETRGQRVVVMRPRAPGLHHRTTPTLVQPSA